MRSVSDTPRNPEYMFNASAHSTECTSTKIRLFCPRPNHKRASGNRAMAGNGLNIDVRVLSKSRPNWVDTASVVKPNARTIPSR
nr:hypothetical protein GCM10020185_29620 [Pseudomonas brassicacearum subsp. brassicacearum]